MNNSLSQNLDAENRQGSGPVVPRYGVLTPIGLGQARITGGFWAHMQNVNATEIILHCYSWMERLGWINNFVAATAGRLPVDRTGREFSDSDVYKLIEAMAWEVARNGDASIENLYRELTSKVVAAQEPDGYLNTMFGRPGQLPRYSDLEWGHELYCFGHLIQAAIARQRTSGEDEFVRAAHRAADHVVQTFGPGGIESVCGHPEIELALVELARVTGNDRYLEQARLFIERRGRGALNEIEFGQEYFQDDIPIREASVLRGHAVRAVYLAAGAIDAAVETQDDELLRAIERQVQRTDARRTYITGGIGAHHEGESFGADWELPSERAYSETCAGIGSIMVHQRMLLATGRAEYADMVERALYNVVATSPGADGHSFFYTNTLHRRTPGTVAAPDAVSARAASSMRSPWFSVSCCPPNVSRTFASLDSYLAAVEGDTVHLLQYAPARIEAHLSGGRAVLEVETEYPRQGTVLARVLDAPVDGVRIAFRIPSWSDPEAVLLVNGESVSPHDGWARTAAPLRVGDTAQLVLGMKPRVVRPDPRIDALRGQIAVERGPVVFCIERQAADQYSVEDLHVVGKPREQDGGVVIPMVPVSFADTPWPFRDVATVRPGQSATDVSLIPYHEWGNHGPSTMRVWMPEIVHG